MREIVTSLLRALMLAGLLAAPFAGAGHALVPMPGCHGAACAEAQVAAPAAPCPAAPCPAAPCPDPSVHSAAPCDLTGCLAQTLAIAAPDVAPAIAERVALTLDPPAEGRAPTGDRFGNPDRPPTV